MILARATTPSLELSATTMTLLAASMRQPLVSASAVLGVVRPASGCTPCAKEEYVGVQRA